MFSGCPSVCASVLAVDFRVCATRLYALIYFGQTMRCLQPEIHRGRIQHIVVGRAKPHLSGQRRGSAGGSSERGSQPASGLEYCNTPASGLEYCCKLPSAQRGPGRSPGR